MSTIHGVIIATIACVTACGHPDQDFRPGPEYLYANGSDVTISIGRATPRDGQLKLTFDCPGVALVGGETSGMVLPVRRGSIPARCSVFFATAFLGASCVAANFRRVGSPYDAILGGTRKGGFVERGGARFVMTDDIDRVVATDELGFDLDMTSIASFFFYVCQGTPT